MRCTFCGYEESKVVDSRPTEEGTSIRRRRECIKCQQRFTTYERIEVVPLVVVKKDGTRQAYDREKLLRGLITACEKRPVSYEELEKIVLDVERQMHNSMEKEFSSHYVGELALAALRDIDEVAYVRFASVYRRFKDINTFKEELESMLNDKK